jgi:hypothetical protein
MAEKQSLSRRASSHRRLGKDRASDLNTMSTTRKPPVASSDVRRQPAAERCVNRVPPSFTASPNRHVVTNRHGVLEKSLTGQDVKHGLVECAWSYQFPPRLSKRRASWQSLARAPRRWAHGARAAFPGESRAPSQSARAAAEGVLAGLDGTLQQVVRKLAGSQPDQGSHDPVLQFLFAFDTDVAGRLGSPRKRCRSNADPRS